MNEEKQVGKAPDFKTNGVDVWANVDKNGKPYLSIKMVGHNTFNVFQYNPEQKKVQ